MMVGSRHIAHAYASGLLPFRCVHCAYASTVAVVAMGVGAGDNPYLLDPEGATMHAQSNAQREATDNATLAASIAQCPRCGRRDDATLTRIKWKTYAGALASALAVIGVCWGVFRFAGVWDAKGGNELVALALALSGALTALAIGWLGSRRWRGMDERVMFISEREEAALARRRASDA